MFQGYLELGGTEIANAARVAAYVEKNAPAIPLTNCWACGDLAIATGEGIYTSPLVDNAPWVDPSDPATLGFYGLYPLSIEGLDDSTRTASVTESVNNGGAVGRVRFATKQFRLRALLVAKDDLALEAGATWLRNALNPSQCDDHGGSCGGAQMCYYAACPTYCATWSDQWVQANTVPFRGITPETSPEIIRDYAQNGSIVKALVVPTSNLDGVIMEVGAVSTEDTGEVVETSGRFIAQRTNVVPNPSFTTNTTGWTMVFGGGLTRVATGGPDGGAFGHFAPDGENIVTTNWAADPSIEATDPAALGWTSPLGPTVRTAVPYAYDGNYVAIPAYVVPQTEEPDTNIDGIMASVYTDVTIPILGPNGSILDETSSTLTVQARYDDANTGITATWIAVQIYDAADTLLSTEFVQVDNSATWTDLGSLLSAWEIGEGYSLRLRQVWSPDLADVGGIPGSAISIDAIGFIDRPATAWFTGDMLTTADDRYFFFNGRATPSVHVEVDGAISTTVSNGQFALSPLANTASFWMRSREQAPVTVQLADAETSALIGSGLFQLTTQWTRYSFSIPYGRSAQMVFVGQGEFDVDQVLVEAGAQLLPYFDGSSTTAQASAGYGDPDDYEVFWTGTVNNSPSRLRYIKPMTIGVNDGLPFAESNTGICDALPFINVIQGTVSGHVDAYERMPISAEDQFVKYERTMHNVTAIEGPTTIQELNPEVGAMREVEIGFVAGHPFIYGATQVLVEPTLMVDLPVQEWDDIVCPDDTPLPIVDPDCVTPPLPPRPPVIADSCIDEETTWQRYWLPVDADLISAWSDMAPTITITSGVQEIRQVRVRVFPNPFNRPITDNPVAEPAVDPCSWCSEFVLSYLPPNTSLTVDAILERAFASVEGGASVSADHLLYASDGGPMTWPALTCGIPYIFTFDVPELLLDDVTVDLKITRRE